MIDTACFLLALFDLSGYTAACVTPEPIHYCDRANAAWELDKVWGRSPSLKFCPTPAEKVDSEAADLSARLSNYR